MYNIGKVDNDSVEVNGSTVTRAVADSPEPEFMHIEKEWEPIDKTKVEKLSDKICTLREEMLDYLSHSVTAHFKSQQVNDPELDHDQKREIAKTLLAQNPGQFLARFGRHIEEKHLEYFACSETTVEEDYEVTFHLRQLHRFHCRAKHQVDVKNRRFQAFKKLVNEGSYFTEMEMKKRNPLLYDQLIGQYLTQREIEERGHAAMVANNTLVGVLLAQIERDQTEKLRQQQLDDEDGAREELDTSDEDSDGEGEEEEEMTIDSEPTSEKDDTDSDGREERIPLPMKRRKLQSNAEKELLKEEFYTSMYHSFLEGKDKDFDYSQVDCNPEFECLTVRTQDEEEKYFDSESPEEMSVADSRAAAEASSATDEDELDIFMKNLKPEPTPIELAGQIKDM